MAACFIALPEGASSLWLHGRVVSPAGRSTQSLFLAQAAHQCECLAPADGSRLVYDCVLTDHAARRELLVRYLVKTGGTMCALRESSSDGGGGAPAFAFEPEAVSSGAPALRLARRLFPEILAQARATLGPAAATSSSSSSSSTATDNDADSLLLPDLLVVRGLLSLSGVAAAVSRWQPLAAEAAPLCSKRRRGPAWDIELSDDEEGEVDSHTGAVAAGAGAYDLSAEAGASREEAGDAGGAPRPGRAAAWLLSRNYEHSRFLPGSGEAEHVQGHAKEDEATLEVGRWVETRPRRR